MTKDFLEGLGLGEEAVEAILAEHRRELEAAEAESESLRRQVGEKENELLGARKDFAVEDELRKFGAKNNKAVRALLDMDAVTFDGEKLQGLIEQLEQLRKENGFLFGANAPRVVGPSGRSRSKGFSFKFTGVR